MKFSHYATKLIIISTTLSAILLTGCQTQSNALVFTPPAPAAVFNTQNQTALVNVSTQDARSSSEVANYVNSGEIKRLTAVPAVAQLFQQVMQQNLNSKGFTLVQEAGNANVTVIVNKFLAEVDQGNIRYKVNANVGVEVKVQGSRGNYSKTFNATRGYESAFRATNPEIQTVLNQAFEDVVKAIYNDNEIGNAIHQFK